MRCWPRGRTEASGRLPQATDRGPQGSGRLRRKIANLVATVMRYGWTVPAPPIRFAILLPMIDLVLWAVLLPTPATLRYIELRRAAGTADPVHLRFGVFEAVVPRKRLFFFIFEGLGMGESQLISGLNAPGVFLVMPISAFTTWPSEWHPKSLPGTFWRSISLPFFCLPAWWFAGRGLDALFGWRRPRWWTLLIGSIFCAGFLVLTVGLFFAFTPPDRADGSMIVGGMALWTMLFAAFPVVWIRRAVQRAPQQTEAAEIAP